MFQTHIGLIRKLRISAFLAGAFLFLLVGLAVFPMASSVDEIQATSKQSETTMTLSTTDLDLALEVDAINGTFSESSANVSVTTNNTTGYTLNIVTGNTGTDAGKLVGENESFNTISSATASADFASESATDMNGLWGYKPSKVNGAVNTSYLPAPIETTTIEQTNTANANANNYTIGLGARADMSYEAGAYTNTFIITSVANPVGYTINFNKNTEDEVTNMPATQSGTTAEQTVVLASEIPEREDYNFLGWCDGTTNGSTCTGTTYQPGDDYDVDQVGDPEETLYAIWRKTNLDYTVNYVNGENTNTVVYAGSHTGASGTEYSHTPNIADDGTKNSDYANDYTMNDVVTISGATKLHVVLTYGGESDSYDWVSLWAGDHPEYTAYDNYSTGLKFGNNTSGKYGGSNGTTVEGDVAGDTVTFAFRSDGSQVGNGYGYYAVVTVASDLVKEVKTGEYITPTDETDVFLGWSKTEGDTTPTYTTEEELLLDIGEEEENTTVYAVWGKPTYVSFNSNGGAGEMETVEVKYNTTTNLPSNTFTKTNAVFVRWATGSSDTGTKYNNGASFTATNPAGANVALYAIWGEQTIISFNNNGGTGEMADMAITYNTSQNLTTNTFTNGDAVFVRWNTKADGTGTNYNDGASYKATTLRGATVTLYAIWGHPTTVNYINGSNTNTVVYGCYDGTSKETRYSHSANIDDAGTRSGEYANNLDTTDVITIPGATRLHVSLKYGTESSSYDWVSMWEGAHADYKASSNYDTGLKFGGNTTGKYAGSTITTVEGDVNGDSITIGFRTDGSSANFYGYYAVVTADVTSVVCLDQPVSGSYVAPTAGANDVFLGWNTDVTATSGYADEAAVIASLDPTTSTTVNLNAIWGHPTTVNFYANGGTGTMNPTIVKYGESTTLTNGFAPPTDHKFKQWNTVDDDTGTAYKGEFTATNIAGETLDLYAIWVESTDPPGTEGGSIDDDSTNWPANSLLRAFELAYVNAGKPMYVEDSTVTSPIPGWRPMTSADEPTIGGKEVRFAMQDISLTFTENGVTKGVCEWAAPSTPATAANPYVDQALVMDKRDGKSYWILKAADGKCWMTQNLDFDIPTTALTSDTTDLTEYGTGGYTSDKGYSNNDGIISWTPQRATIPASSISSSGSISGWSNNYNNPYSVDTGNWYWTDTWYNDACTSSPYCNYLSGNANGKFSQTPYANNDLHGHVGNYYNWSAAIASNNTSNYTSSTYSTPENNPGNSICPAGWKLPVIASYTSGQLGNNDFYNLVYTQGGNNWNSDQNITAGPLWFVRGGYVTSSSLYDSGSYGSYWSSTVDDSLGAYSLGFTSGFVYTTNDYYRGGGRSVRCIAR